MMEIAIAAGILILIVAALSQMQQMWANARYGLEENPRNPDFHSQERFFDAWAKACRDLGLTLLERDGDAPDLQGPAAVGTRRRLKARLDMELRSSTKNYNPQHLNPASTDAQIKGRVELPFPWHAVSVHRFAHTRGYDPGDPDDLTLHLDLLPDLTIDGLRLDERARDALSEAVDDLQALRLRRGIAQVRQSADPARNVGRWPQIFGDAIAPIFSHLGRLATGGIHIQATHPNLAQPLTIHLQPSRHGEPSCQAIFIVPTDQGGDVGDAPGLQSLPPADGARRWRTTLACTRDGDSTVQELNAALEALLDLF